MVIETSNISSLSINYSTQRGKSKHTMKNRKQTNEHTHNYEHPYVREAGA